MTINVISVYPEMDAARAAVDDLVRSGFREDDIALLGAEEEESEEKLIEDLVHRGFSEDDARVYVAAVQHRHPLVAARAQDDAAEEVSRIMDRHGALPWDELEQEARQPEGEQRQEPEEGSIQLVEEELRPSKKQEVSGKRLVSEVIEEQKEFQIPIKEEKIEVKESMEERELSPEEAEEAFKEKSIEMTATSEIPELEKKARIVGQVFLEKETSERTASLRATVRKTKVNVEDVQPKEEGEKQD